MGTRTSIRAGSPRSESSGAEIGALAAIAGCPCDEIPGTPDDGVDAYDTRNI